MGKGELACDPRGLILEAYRMDLTPAEARSIFLDWALGQEGRASAAAELLTHYGARQPEHPMTSILRDAATTPARSPAGRRGGARARRP